MKPSPGWKKNEVSVFDIAELGILFPKTKVYKTKVYVSICN